MSVIKCMSVIISRGASLAPSREIAHQPFGCLGLATALDQNMKDEIVLIDSKVYSLYDGQRLMRRQS